MVTGVGVQMKSVVIRKLPTILGTYLLYVVRHCVPRVGAEG